MKNRRHLCLEALFLGTVLLAQGVAPLHDDRGTIVVANRGSGSISVIDANSDCVELTLSLPASDAAPEPMYVVQDRRRRTWVGDRANQRVVYYDHRFRAQGSVDAGSGVFHMWVDPRGRELWVVNDIDDTATVIDTDRQRVLATVPMPVDLVRGGAFPHDVTVSRSHAYVSMIDPRASEDVIVQIDRRTLEETSRLRVGKDPHVALAGPKIFVPCQGSDAVFVLGARDLSLLKVLDVPGAHGAIVDRRRKRFYTTNISGGGMDALWTIDARRNRIIGDGVDAPQAAPHNVALDRRGEKLYVTHSGAEADTVSVYVLCDGRPRFQKEIQVGTNPFGLAFAR